MYPDLESMLAKGLYSVMTLDTACFGPHRENIVGPCLMVMGSSASSATVVCLVESRGFE